MWPTGQGTARFFGAYTHTLDAKGRLTLPSKFRSHFTDKAYVTSSQYGDDCLVIWTEEDFLRYTNQVGPEQWGPAEERRRLRRWARGAGDLEIDRMGRVVLPLALRERVSLSHDVLVQGAFETIELWDPETWRRYDQELA
jgi:MraZ protein